MIKATDIVVEKDYGLTRRDVRAELVADTSSEVIAIGNNGTTVVNLSANDTMTFGSTCLCADGSFGMLDSTGAWQF